MAKRAEVKEETTQEKGVQEASASEEIPTTQEKNESLLQAVKASYKREELIRHAESALGVPGYVVAGALTEDEYTVAAAKKAIEAFKGKGVK
ncbi:hypothetical protein AM501_26855 [Aneurinibacillus migulanus]|uniref:hypothetical protein n=1 Tax=Aneurinibacillus migulanus TaxID=47500 RepID=UPI0005BA173D|nr:hypothetical protein [Aneurinibacillus migulanus]KIV55052.1 hypothetical protein TS64_12290 [Aneurinibacillus migulanus]KPD05337.1 hypothetical protein AM501_26855 [Aneurinibacillus migulanus]